MRYLTMTIAATLLVACSDGSSTRTQATPPPNPAPPGSGLPPGIAGVDIGAKSFVGQMQIAVSSELPFVDDFGPAVVDLEVAISGGNDHSNAEFLASVFASTSSEQMPPFLLELSNLDGELTLALDFTRLCGSALVLEVPASVNPENTINVAAVDTEESCQMTPVTIAMNSFSLQEVAP